MQMITEVFSEQDLKPKERIQKLLTILESGDYGLKDFVDGARNCPAKHRVYGLEALEIFTRVPRESDTSVVWDFAAEQLSQSSPAVLREAGRVIANLASNHADSAADAIAGLLKMSEHSGTVVRWSAAQGLTRIFLADQKSTWNLKSTLEAIMTREEKESIRRMVVRVSFCLGIFTRRSSYPLGRL
jgi:hypothetical protein